MSKRCLPEIYLVVIQRAHCTEYLSDCELQLPYRLLLWLNSCNTNNFPIKWRHQTELNCQLYLTIASSIQAMVTRNLLHQRYRLQINELRYWIDSNSIIASTDFLIALPYRYCWNWNNINHQPNNFSSFAWIKLEWRELKIDEFNIRLIHHSYVELKVGHI